MGVPDPSICPASSSLPYDRRRFFISRKPRETAAIFSFPFIWSFIMLFYKKKEKIKGFGEGGTLSSIQQRISHAFTRGRTVSWSDGSGQRRGCWIADSQRGVEEWRKFITDFLRRCNKEPLPCPLVPPQILWRKKRRRPSRCNKKRNKTILISSLSLVFHNGRV